MASHVRRCTTSRADALSHLNPRIQAGVRTHSGEERESRSRRLKRNAKSFGISDLVGSLTPGKFADILVVRGDPSRNISDVRNVQAVFKGGSEVYAAPAVSMEPKKA
jgi:Amidohydrolase family